ncbi:MAG: hypothetical protein HY226_05835 [Candidatus Vogelbacteria bacterium]|nr:hypothetical protein [Candidatus Vogelbacteria bacterium]
MLRRTGLLLFLAILLFPFLSVKIVHAVQTLENTGLITRNIWYSKDPFYAGDKIRIYSVVFNGSILDLRGRVNFYDKGTLLCTSEFSVLSGGVSNVWCDWGVGVGKHSISIRITNPRGSIPGGDEAEVILSSDQLATSDVVVGDQPVVAQNVNPVMNSQDPVVNTIANQPQSSGIISRVLSMLGASPDTLSVKNNQAIQSGSVINSSTKKTKLGRSNNISKVIKQSTATVLAGAGASVIPVNSNLSLNNVASVWEVFKNFVSNIPYLTQLRNWILAELKSFTTTDNKPLSYVALFVYVVFNFVLNSPIILTLLFIYTIWWLCRRAIRSRYR